jgi:copper chaperone CopZ
MTQTFSIAGMTCQNCARHVREALLELTGVRIASIDLPAGLATIEADAALPRERVAEALESAGYALA